MKIRELRIKPEKELKETLSGLRDKLRELRFNLAGGKVKNIREIRQTKGDVARILTLLNTSPRPAYPLRSETSRRGRLVGYGPKQDNKNDREK